MDRIPKYRIPVRISLPDDGSVLGVIFIRQEQRILDMLCEPKQFFPLSTRTGMLLINKSCVIKVEVLEKDFIEKNLENFPDGDVTADFHSHALGRRRAGYMETA